MKVIRNVFLPFPGFDCINLFGLLFARKGVRVDAEMLRHEAIHTRQMQEMLFLPFYVWYLGEWSMRFAVQLITLPWVEKGKRRHHLYSAYANLLFEREAYRHAGETDYLQHRQPYAWLTSR